MSLFRSSLPDASIFQRNSPLLLTLGVLLFILGCVSIGFSVFTTLLSVIFLGAIILASGILILVDTLTVWRNSYTGFFLHLITGLLYIVVGVMFIHSPVAGAISITLLLGILFLVAGLFRLFYSIAFRGPQWGWSLLNGIISIILGYLILSGWPAASLFIIGLFIGIDLIFAGITYIMLSMAVKE